jgi:hypothetical protein
MEYILYSWQSSFFPRLEQVNPRSIRKSEESIVHPTIIAKRLSLLDENGQLGLYLLCIGSKKEW